MVQLTGQVGLAIGQSQQWSLDGCAGTSQDLMFLIHYIPARFAGFLCAHVCVCVHVFVCVRVCVRVYIYT